MLTVTVGTNGTTYPIHQSLVCASSKFFRSAVKPEWTSSKADPRAVDLSEEVPGTFEIYVHWLYFKTLPTVRMEPKANIASEYKDLARCYVLGEKLIDIEFKNAVLDSFADAMADQLLKEHRFPGVQEINIIYKGTMEDSPARELLVDIWAHHSLESWNILLELLPAEFILDLTKAFITLRPSLKRYGIDRWKACIADYHEN